MNTSKQREAGKLAFPKDTRPTLQLVRPQLVLVPPPPGSDHLIPKVEPSQEIKEMLHEMNQKRRAVKDSDPPEAA